VSIHKIAGKKIKSVYPSSNSLTIFFEDECRLTLKIEGRVIPRMMYELYVAESYMGEIDEAVGVSQDF